MKVVVVKMKISLLFGSIALWIWFILLFVTHEYGHIHIAKKQGIYKGWKILPNPTTKLTRYYNNKWDYLSGLYGSLLSLPIYLVTGLPIWVFLFLIISASIMDFVVIIFYDKLKKTESGDIQLFNEKEERLKQRYPNLTRWHII